MITSRIIGGLGNQLFCLSAGYSLAKELKREFRIDISYYCKRYHPVKTQGYFYPYKLNVPQSIQYTSGLQKEINGILGQSRKGQRVYNYFWPKYFENIQNDILKIKNSSHCVLTGFNQNYKMILKYRDELLNLIGLNEEPYFSHDELRSKIRNQNKSISLHLRLGDYLNNKFSKVFTSLPRQYYLNILSDYPNHDVYVFSNDIVKAREFLGIDANYINSGSEIDDFLLFPAASVRVISNSTFSWWSAFREDSNKVTYFPKNWFVDPQKPTPIMPAKWLMS